MNHTLLASPRHGPAEPPHENEPSDVNDEVAPRGASVGSASNHKHASKGAGAPPMANDCIRGANSASVDVGRFALCCLSRADAEICPDVPCAQRPFV